MSKELIVSCSSHETKIAILEDDQVAEVYFERGKEYSLAGSIYKGRVTRVLPGMQSAFVDVGLERDAFLYVSDFLEDTEEYDRIASTVEEKVIKMDEDAAGQAAAAAPSAAVAPAAQTESAEPGPPAGPSIDKVAAERSEQPRAPEPAKASPPERQNPRERFSRHSRRRRPHHKGFPDSKYARQPAARENISSPPAAAPSEAPAQPPIILPGESLAKYRSWPPAEPVQLKSEGFAGSVEEIEGPPAESLPSVPEYVEETIPESRYRQEEEREPLAPEALAEEPAAGLPVIEERIESERPVARVNAERVAAPSVRAQEESSPVQEEAWRTTPPPLPAQARGEQADSEDQPSAAQHSFSPGVSSFEFFPSEPAVPEFPDAGIEAASEEIRPESSVPKMETPGEGVGPGGSGMPQQAAVRDSHRNPRYMRRGRWAGRNREGRPPSASQRPAGRPREREAPQPMIADLLKEGQNILVQIAKEPLGKKGARITSHIALPGRYLVYMPTVDHVGVSRKIASDEERQRLKRIILEHSKGILGGFIVRTAGEGRSEEDFRQDIQYLSKLWAEIRTQAEKSSAPVLLHHDLNLVLRILRDQFSEDFSAVWVDNEQEYEKILSLVSKFQPALVNRVKLYTKDVPLFEELGIQEEINKALKPKVWLKSGGYIVINQTEALVAIDVNTGKFVGKSNRLEDTIVKTNVEAIREIVRQVRLRDLGGIIVIDFIDMDEKKNRQKVMAAMEEALRADRAPSKILSFNEFGLVAITRKRVRQSLERTLSQPCAYCGGSGLVKSVTTVCNEILSEAKKLASELERKQITLRVNPEIGKALKSRDSTILQEIEDMTGKAVIIRNDPALHIENFDFN